jgi:hypothetical protein
MDRDSTQLKLVALVFHALISNKTLLMLVLTFTPSHHGSEVLHPHMVGIIGMDYQYSCALLVITAGASGLESFAQ